MIQSFISDGQSPYLWSAYDDAIDPRERWFFAGTKGGNLSGWAIGGSNLPEYKIGPTKEAGSSLFRGFSDKGDLLIFTQGRSLMLYDVETGKLVKSFPNLLRKSRGLPLYKLHTDDKTLAVNYCEAADVFDLEAGKKLFELSLVCKERFSIAESYPVDSDLITFHPNKDFLLTVSDKTIRIWNSKNGSLIQTMIAPDRIENKRKDNNKDDGLTRLAGWMADGKYLFAVTADQRSILIWEINDR